MLCGYICSALYCIYSDTSNIFEPHTLHVYKRSGFGLPNFPATSLSVGWMQGVPMGTSEGHPAHRRLYFLKDNFIMQ